MSSSLSRFLAARRHDLVALVGRSEPLYFALQYALRRPSRFSLVDEHTDLCVEAPPGSGNSFFVQGFAMANPDARLAHHHHVSAQIRRASRYEVPTLLIVRNPIDCVLSRAVSWQSPDAIGPSYRQWIAFWSRVSQTSHHSVIVDFSEVTDNARRTIRRLNTRFGRSFSEEFPSSEDVFRAMDLARGSVYAFDPSTDINPNRPDARKEEIRRELKPLVEGHHLAKRAKRLYADLRATAYT